MNDFAAFLAGETEDQQIEAMRPPIIQALNRLEQGISVFDADLRMVLFNQAFVDLLRLPSDVVRLGIGLNELTCLGMERGDCGPSEVETLVGQCIGRGECCEGCQAQHVRLDGTALELCCYTLPGGGFIVTNRDVTERNRAEGRLEDAVQSLAEGFMLWDADDRLITCNDRVREVYPGLDDILVPGRRFEDNLRESVRRGVIVVPPDVHREQWIAERIERHRNPSEPIERRTRAGRWLRIVEHRTSEGGIVGVVVDVTNLKNAGEALQRSEQRFKDFASASSDWFWEMGPDLRFSWFSEGMDRIIGIAPNRMIGLTREELGQPNPEDEKWVRHLADLRARRPFRDFRYPARDDRGADVHLSVSGVPVFDADGRFQGYRGTGTNVTAEVIAQKKAAEAQERLSDAIESLTDGFALYDADDRLVLFNDNYRRALSGIADLLVPGARFEDLFRALVERNQLSSPRGREEEWIRDRLQERKTPNALRSYETADDRWIEVREYATHEGGRVIIRNDATATKQAEQDLRRSQASLANAQRIAHVGNWDLTVTSNEFWWSDEIYRIFGFGAQAFPATYDRFLDIVHPDDRNQVQGAVDAALYRDAAYGFEHRIVLPDGSERIVRQEGEVTFDDLGTPLHMTGTVQDVTEQRQAERALREVEERFRLAFETSPDAMTISRMDDDRYVDINDGYLAMTGYCREEVIGKTSADIDFWARPGDRDRSVGEVIGGGQIRNVEVRFRRKTGEVRTALVSASVLTLNGEPHLLAITKDISELKKAEEERRKLERAVEQGPAAVIVTDTDGTIEYVNPKFTEMTGYGRDEAVGLNPRVLKSDTMDRADYAALWSTIKDGREWRGELCNRRKDGSTYWASASISPIKGLDGNATHFIGIQEDITPRKIYEQRLHYQANFDAVTDLPNRTLALDRLNSVVASAKRHSRKVGILFIDLDHFKKINDTLGHALGDRFLRQAGERIKSSVREEDTVARLGGDEFTVILPDIKSSKDPEGVARKIIEAFSRPFALDGHEAFVSASVGITLCPDDADDPERLMRNADSAMYQAKESGRNTLRFFTPELNERALDRIRMESELRHGLEREEFALHYQPLVDIRTDRIVGAEALLRWHSPELGTVGPDQFIRLAEDTGLIIPIGEWVLTTACRQAKSWQAEASKRFRLSVNVSSRQFKGTALVDAVARALKSNRFPAECLELEITEGLLMDDLPETMATIRTLEARGVRLAVDDFGTGYSSLSYLNRFPLDTLKIDRSFTHGMIADRAQATLVEAIIAMAHHLGLRVIAEGVETREQLEFLRARGCDVAQGYYFSPPVPHEEFTKLLETWRQKRARAG